jgi:hypothetical protein
LKHPVPQPDSADAQIPGGAGQLDIPIVSATGHDAAKPSEDEPRASACKVGAQDHSNDKELLSDSSMELSVRMTRPLHRFQDRTSAISLLATVR